LHESWKRMLSNGTFIVRDDPFWTTAHPFTEMKLHSPKLYSELTQYKLIIFKVVNNILYILIDLDYLYIH